MKISLKYPISVNVYPINEFSYDDVYTYNVNVGIKDIVEYFYYKKYNKYYNELSWYLEDGAKEFVKSIEDDWLYNRIDEYALFNDKEFKKFLKLKYEEEACSKYESGLEVESIKEEMKDFIEDNFEVDFEVISYE